MKSVRSLLAGVTARRSIAAAPVALVAVVLLCSACGGASANASPPGASSTPSTSVPFQGAIGQVAALTPPSMEVQNPQSGQTTVNWTTSTTFSQTVSVAASTVANGDCVVVSGTPASPGSTSSPVTARTVSIVQPSASGSCTNPSGAGVGPVFRGGFPGGRTFGGGGGFSRTSTPGNGSFPGGTFPQLATAVGKVTSTSSSGFVVHGVERSTGRFRPGSTTSSTTTTTQPPTTDITVTVASSTTATQDESASASALSVGACVTALGPSNSTGAVAATSISIRPSTNGSCFGGFGGFRSRSGTTGSGSANA